MYNVRTRSSITSYKAFLMGYVYSGYFQLYLSSHLPNIPLHTFAAATNDTVQFLVYLQVLLVSNTIDCLPMPFSQVY